MVQYIQFQRIVIQGGKTEVNVAVETYRGYTPIDIQYLL